MTNNAEFLLAEKSPQQLKEKIFQMLTREAELLHVIREMEKALEASLHQLDFCNRMGTIPKRREEYPAWEEALSLAREVKG